MTATLHRLVPAISTTGRGHQCVPERAQAGGGGAPERACLKIHNPSPTGRSGTITRAANGSGSDSDSDSGRSVALVADPF